MKKKKTYLINKKRIFILICLTLLVIFEVVALQRSKAAKVIEISATVEDNEEKLEPINVMLEATNSGASGYYLNLPEYINSKRIGQYYIIEKEIHTKKEENIENTETNNVLENLSEENVITNENPQEITNTEEPLEETNTESQLDVTSEIEEPSQQTTVTIYPGERLFLTEDELSNKSITLRVSYNTLEKNENILYEQKIETQVDDDGDGQPDTNIIIEGFMPLDATISATKVEIEQIQGSLEPMLSKKVSFKRAYDIKIITGETEYEPTEFDTNVKVTITGLEKIDENNQKYKVVHIEDTAQEENTAEVTEIDAVQTIEDEVSFPADSFSTYALLLEDGLGSVATFSSDLGNAKVWDGTSATKIENGNGTQESPYLITNGAELSYLANQVNSGNSYEGSYFELIVDIDFNDRDWTPIGNYTNPFKGIFNGEGHTIANFTIPTSSSIPTSILSYGLFGSIGDSSSKTIIKNLQVDNAKIEINASGTLSNASTERGYTLGIITGTIFNNAEITNVIVNNSSITDNYTLTINSYNNKINVGGIAGLAVNSRTSETNPGAEKRYKIENCYSNTNVDLSIRYNNNTYSLLAQYNVGGIIGLIRGQDVWPSNCMYTGDLDATNAFTGPIFGALRYNTALSTQNYMSIFNTLWQGNDAGNLTMDSYYTSYSTNNRSFTTTVASGTSSSRISTSSRFFRVGYVQGVNKGLYTNNAQNMLTNFNNYVTNNSSKKLLTWHYNSSTKSYYFTPELSAEVEKDSPRYIIHVNDLASTGNYTYNWNISGTPDPSITGNIATINSSWTEEYKVYVIASNGQSYALVEFTIPLLELHISFEYNQQSGRLTGNIDGTGTIDPNFNLNDYTYKWYKLDISGTEEELEGETTNQISNLENGYEYKIVATNAKYSYMNVDGTYLFGERTVIYCDYNNGSNYNDGFTPDTAVRSLSTAYGKFSSQTTRNENVIVLMGTYTDTSYLQDANSTTYKKNVTITGKYGGIDYTGKLNFESYNNYKYLNGNTTFMYMSFVGTEASYWGGGSPGQTYFYLQGYSLTMGEGIKMEGYAQSNVNQGLIEGTAPAFHMFAGWMQYDETRLPRTGAEIIIKSGTYGRVLLGGSSGTSGASSITKYNSRNFMGTSLTDDLYKCKATIDIKNSTTDSSYTYDINLLGGGSTCGNIYGDIEINIKNGKVGRLLGASIGDSSYRPNNWNYPINTFIGTATINMYGGSVTEMYGGCLGRNMNAIGGTTYNLIRCDSYFYGTVNINIFGGTISQTIYGAGAGGVSGYSVNSTDAYKSYGQNVDTNININIYGGMIDADIYGGGYGYTNYLTANSTQTDGGTLYGNSNINISGSPTINGSIYGGGRGYNLASNKPDLAQMEGESTITISGSPTINGSIYGAGMGLSEYANMAKFTGTTNININTDLSINVYGGGNIAKTIGTTNVNINSGNHTQAIYGGGNVGILEGTSNVQINGGTSLQVYGGGNQAEVTTPTVTINAGNNENVYGGGNQAGITNSTVTVKGGNNQNIFGGGNQAGAESTQIIILDGDSNNVYGGSNASGVVTSSNIQMQGGNAMNIYGGNNEGGNTETSNITVSGGVSGNVFGGGNKANTTTSNVTVTNGKVTDVYGGANQANVTTTNVIISGGNIERAFGGSNQSGTVSQSNVSLEGSSGQPTLGGIKMDVDYKAVVMEDWRKQQNPGYETYVTVNIKYTNNTDTTINKWSSYINAPDSKLLDNYSSDSNIIEENGKYTINQDSRWTSGNIHSLPANGTYEIRDIHLASKLPSNEFSLVYNFEGQGNNGNQYQDTNTGFTIFGGNNQGGETTTSNVNIKDGYCFAVYGGNNAGGTNPTSNVTVDGGEANDIYGGNNLGGTNSTSNVIVNGGKVANVYGGGNKAVTTKTNVTVQNNANVQEAVFGGGNQASIRTDTDVKILGGIVVGNVYGGGNEGTVIGNTNVHVKNAEIQSSVYAGGNGVTAVVYQNANATVEGTSTKILGSVFGGGNQAATGTIDNNNSLSKVNIVGASVGKNVYGGANTSVVYGNTLTNIGYEAVNDTTLEQGDIVIEGTVFGGGEANASGSEIYDFSFISVTVGIDININGTGHNKCQIKGSIFGSGNASSTSGYSYINIKNYGSVYSPQKNVSIQRTNVVTLDNSAIALSGTKDRTNEYSDVDFTLSRIDELKIKNNSILYLDCGANLLKKFTSCVDENGAEVKAQATINEETGDTTRNVDNRIYMLEGKNLNIATNEQVTAYGEVSGMTFFGIYTNSMSPSTSTGLYNKEYNNGDKITNAGTFSSNSYVRGLHKTDHDITIDGFYSNYDEEENQGYIRTRYIEPSPKDDVYYIWLIGLDMDVTTFEVALTASKYATLGTYELGLTGFSESNIKFSLTGFSAGLTEGVSLVNPNSIESVSLDPDVANNVFGLTMKTGNNGWVSNSQTTFLTANGGTYTGATAYDSDNSTFTPALNLCFYHSENITLARKLGSVRIRLQAQIPEDDLNVRIAYIDIVITMSTALYQNDFYEAAITPGEEFGLFTTTETNITDSSVFSTYYSLYIPEFSTSDYYEKYKEDKHVIVSRLKTGEKYVFPEKTKITMIDMVTNQYYYYVVSQDDEAQEKYVYNLSDFVVMGSDSTYYDEVAACDKYYNAEQDLIYENFIFHIDFGENNITSNLIQNSLLMELRDSEGQTLLGVLGIQRDTMVYSVYKDKDAKIKVKATTNKDLVYRGKDFVLTVETDFTQDIVDSKTVYDTGFFDDKMGIKISIYDNNGNRLNSDSLLGVNFTLNGVKYYPRIDGTVRICTAEKVSNVLSKIKVDTANNTVLATGDYTIKVESFGSPDGIYYGIESSDTAEVKITIVESTFGLKVTTIDQEKIINKDTGRNENGTTNVTVNIEYSSGLDNPNITLSLYRRDYSSIYSQVYELVDLAQYVNIVPSGTKNENEYIISQEPSAVMKHSLSMKGEGLTSGTYKIVIKLYDGDEYIGEAYDYLIIK